MDLRSLSKSSESAAHATAVPTPRRRWLTRKALPAGIVLIMLALVAYAARDVLLPAQQVEVTRAIAIPRHAGNDTSQTPGQAPQGPAQVVAQAPGWVEPDPYPIYVTALADGIVEQIFVLEGEKVQAGQTLIQLVDEDARLQLQKARADLANAKAARAAAKSNLDEPLALQRGKAVAQARVAEAKAALIRLDAEVAKEQALLSELDAAYQRLKSMSDRSVSPLKVEEAKYKVQSQRAVVEATRQRRPELEAHVDAAKAQLTEASRDDELKTELKRAFEQGDAQVQAAEARVAEAELRLQRMTIKSPIDGVVMARLVAPGAKLMLAADQPHSAHPIHLYRPDELQVRVDVPLVDAAAVGVGQRARIVVDVLPDVEFEGVVTRLVHLADIAKNTVQFKVAITDPSPLLKPDMLARVKFLSGNTTPNSSGGNAAATPAGTTAVAIHKDAIVEGGVEGPFVWWVSPDDSRLLQRPVELGTERDDGYIEIANGLNPGDAVVLNPDALLTKGQRVRIHETPNND